MVADLVRQHVAGGPFGAGVGLEVPEKNGIVQDEALAAFLAGEGVFDVGGFQPEPLGDADGAAYLADDLPRLFVRVENERVFVFHVGIERAAPGDAHALLGIGRNGGKEDGDEEQERFVCWTGMRANIKK